MIYFVTINLVLWQHVACRASRTLYGTTSLSTWVVFPHFLGPLRALTTLLQNLGVGRGMVKPNPGRIQNLGVDGDMVAPKLGRRAAWWHPDKIPYPVETLRTGQKGSITTGLN